MRRANVNVVGKNGYFWKLPEKEESGKYLPFWKKMVKYPKA